MSALRLVRRLITFSVAACSIASFTLTHQQAHPQPADQQASLPSVRSYAWTPRLAALFPGCVASLPAGVVPSAFVVQRLDGSFERMAFDDAWRRTHDAQHADDVWVFGACRPARSEPAAQ